MDMYAKRVGKDGGVINSIENAHFVQVTLLIKCCTFFHRLILSVQV